MMVRCHSPCTHIAWNNDGGHVAVLLRGASCGQLTIFNVDQFQVCRVVVASQRKPKQP
jgi:hypothetical protein